MYIVKYVILYRYRTVAGCMIISLGCFLWCFVIPCKKCQNSSGKWWTHPMQNLSKGTNLATIQPMLSSNVQLVYAMLVLLKATQSLCWSMTGCAAPSQSEWQTTASFPRMSAKNLCKHPWRKRQHDRDLHRSARENPGKIIRKKK